MEQRASEGRTVIIAGDWLGNELSDHPPVAVLFAWAKPLTGAALESGSKLPHSESFPMTGCAVQ